MMRFGFHTVAAAFFGLCGLPAFAENVVNLHAVFADAPTPWCAQDEGLPVVVTMDGPDVGGTSEVQFFITQRHGTERIQVPIPPPADYSDARSAFTGRFVAKLEVCHQYWEPDRVNGDWKVVNGAKTLASGTHATRFGHTGSLPLFRKGWQAEDYTFKLSDGSVLVAEGPLKITKTMEAFASPAEEQEQ